MIECEFCWENDNPALPSAWEDFDFSLKPPTPPAAGRPGSILEIELESTGTEEVVANFDFGFKVYDLPILVLVLVGGFIFIRNSTLASDDGDDGAGATPTPTATSSADVSISLSTSILFDLRQQSLEDLLMGVSEKSSLLALRFRPTVCC